MNKTLEEAATLQNILISCATGGVGDSSEYTRLRQMFVSEPKLPSFVRTCRDLSQFWGFIQPKFKHYRERREFLWNEFQPFFDYLEKGTTPSDNSVATILKKFDQEHVHNVWSKALERRQTDPEGAVTTARTLLETVCKNILDDFGTTYDSGADLPKLYKLTAENLHIAPSQHTEAVFKQILGGCSAVIEGLGSLRNRISDAHGQGKKPVKPAPRHAELAVNLSGTMASFLVATWEAKKNKILKK